LVWICVGGVGDATLVAALGKLCASAGIVPLRAVGRDDEPSPASFLTTLRRGLGSRLDASPIEVLQARPGLRALPVDRSDGDVSASASEAPTSSPSALETSLTLDQPEFAAAVREALRHLTSADLLSRNPLVRSRIVDERVGGEDGIEARVAALQVLVQEVVASLGASSRRAKLQRALHYTYLEPAGSQERVAELLNLPFSTYRDHLKAGIQLVGEILWQRETDAQVRPALGSSAWSAHPATLTGA